MTGVNASEDRGSLKVLLHNKRKDDLNSKVSCKSKQTVLNIDVYC